MSLDDRRPPAAYLHDGTVITPQAVAAWAHQHFDLEGALTAARAAGPQAVAWLHAMTISATSNDVPEAEPVRGTALDRSPELAAPSPDMSTTTAADALGMTDRGVRKAIADGRLTATVTDGRHRISTDDLARFRAARSA